MKQKGRTSNTRKWLWTVLILLVLTPYIGLYVVKCWYDNKVNDIANARFIIVDKEQLQLHLMDYEGNEVKAYGICCGKNYGDKQVIGDMKTPDFLSSEMEMIFPSRSRDCCLEWYLLPAT